MSGYVKRLTQKITYQLEQVFFGGRKTLSFLLMRKLNIFTWHIHGSYLAALTQTLHNWYVPVRTGRPARYSGRGTDSLLPAYVQEVPANEVRQLALDLILFQSPENYLEDQYEIFSDEQRRLPRIYLEHNTPKPYPVQSVHWVDDPATLLVHVTRFNALMWDCGRTPTAVIEHSVLLDPDITYDGSRAEGIAVVNEFVRRDRIAGYDLFREARREVPLTTAGLGSDELGGLGEIHYRRLPYILRKYRFLFSPMRYTSFPLAVVEAMTIGMPVVALATTEIPSVLQDGVHGFISNDPAYLTERMKLLLADPELARDLGSNARQLARKRFGLERFVSDWNRIFDNVTASYSGLHEE